MSMGNTTGPRPPTRKKSRWKGVLAGWLFIFGVGFFSGIQTTKKVAASSYQFLQKVMGLEGLLTSAQPLTPLGTPPPRPTPINAGAPSAPVVPPTVQQTAPSNTAATSPAPTPRDEPDAPPPANPDELDTMVARYNILLRNLESAAASYQDAKKITANPNAPQEEQTQAIHKQSEAAEKIVSNAHEANNLYDYIHAQSQFAVRYRETSPAISGAQLLKGLPELSVENLKFIRPKH
ncbi:MAG: hypothetical protein NT023_08065 [Armatimonadetes bacterium]|nr:hypothetical protein [Armatimonadota bacterium]